MSDKTPEPGTRCKVIVDGKEEYAIWSGQMWWSETSERILDPSEFDSWEEAPH